MTDIFKDLIVVELAGVLAGPSVGLFFAELGAKVIKIENSKTGGDVTRNWKLASEDQHIDTSAYYWSVNSNKEITFLDLTKTHDLEKFYTLVKMADILITNYKLGDDKKLKVDYVTLKALNPKLIYASVNGFGNTSSRTAYDLILQAESGFMSINGEKNAKPLKLPVALIDLLAGHQLKEAILIALLQRYKNGQGCKTSVSLFDSALASLANQATNWLIAHQLPVSQGSLHPNIAPYGEIFTTHDQQQITFAIGNDKQFKKLCFILQHEDLANHPDYLSNQQRVMYRTNLALALEKAISKFDFQVLFDACLQEDIPIGKIRNLKEVFELPEASAMLNHFKYQNEWLTSVKSVAFKFT